MCVSGKVHKLFTLTCWLSREVSKVKFNKCTEEWVGWIPEASYENIYTSCWQLSKALPPIHFSVLLSVNDSFFKLFTHNSVPQGNFRENYSASAWVKHWKTQCAYLREVLGCDNGQWIFHPWMSPTLAATAFYTKVDNNSTPLPRQYSILLK